MSFRRRVTPFACSILVLAAGCGGDAPGTGAPNEDAPTGEPPTLRQTAAAVRVDAEVPLDADTGWVAPSGGVTRVPVDTPLRIRFEAETRGAVDGVRLRLQARGPGGRWEAAAVSDFPYPAEERGTPLVAIDSVSAYAPDEPTTDLLAGSSLPFSAGAGVTADSAAPAWSAEDAHGEWEFALVLRRWGDGPVTHEESDTVQLRLAGLDGTPAAGDPLTLVLDVPDGHLGGTFVETPGVLGPWEASDGSLYFVMEPTETDNVLMTVRSRDGGVSWEEVDGGNRPVSDDLEGFATTWADGVVHMLHQQSEAVWHHAFATTDAPGGDEGWVVRDRLVARPGEPPTQVATLVARPDGSLLGVYGGPDKLRMQVFREGAWGGEVVLDADVPPNLSGPHATVAADGTTHLVFTGLDGSVWYRPIGRDDAPGPRLRLATGIGTAEEDAGAVAPPVVLEPAGVVVVAYRLADGRLMERRILPGGGATEAVPVTERRVVRGPVDSDQIGADLIAHEGVAHLLFIDEETRDLRYTRSAGDGAWSPARPVVQGIEAQWVRGRPLRTDQGWVYGFVYDAGSDGGSGMNRYGTVPLAP